MKNFIKENNISFEPGSRNSNVVVLIGYAQHKGLSCQKLIDELEEEITKDIFILEEINRLWNYCENNNYKSFWKTKAAKVQYNFIDEELPA